MALLRAKLVPGGRQPFAGAIAAREGPRSVKDRRLPYPPHAERMSSSEDLQLVEIDPLARTVLNVASALRVVFALATSCIASIIDSNSMAQLARAA